jgi:enoyl-[acyl-carrier protein] reductase I
MSMNHDDRTSPLARRAEAAARAPSRSLVTIEDVGFATAALATDAARLITGDSIYIDGGYHIMG